MKDRRRRGQAENDENERGQNGGKRQKRRAVLVERRGQQDWKRPMLDRDQLLSPTCLVDGQIIARSLHGPGTRLRVCLSVLKRGSRFLRTSRILDVIESEVHHNR